MEKLKEALRQIFEMATNAPELNMANYNEDQVAALNNAMLEIYHITERALAEESTELSNCNKPQVSKCEGIEREALLLAFAEFLDYETFADLLAQPEYYVKRFLSQQ